MSGRTQAGPVRPGRPREGDRRSASRHHCGWDVSLTRLRGDRRQTRWACAHNVSRRGIGLVLHCWIPRGAALLFELPDESPARRRIVAGRVIHRWQRPDGNWYVGCAFDEEIGEDWFGALIQGF